jgi:hypothetical protein
MVESSSQRLNIIFAQWKEATDMADPLIPGVHDQ